MSMSQNPSMLQMVEEFHRVYERTIGDGKTIPSAEDQELRLRLIEEELQEYRDAAAAGDFIAVADALADLTYVVLGAAVIWGLPLDEIYSEVHRSNMSKLGADGKPLYREDGKVLKGPNFSPPDIRRIYEQARRDADEKQFERLRMGGFYPTASPRSPDAPCPSRTTSSAGHKQPGVTMFKQRPEERLTDFAAHLLEQQTWLELTRLPTHASCTPQGGF